MGYNNEEASRKIKLVIKQINGIPDEIDENGNETELIPEIAIGSGTESYYIHCYSPGKKRFIKISSGQKGYIIDEMQDNKEKYLVYTYDGHLVEILEEEIHFTGFD